MIPYYNPLVLDRIVTSVDAIRVKFTYSKSGYDFEHRQRFDTLNSLLNTLTSEQLYMEGLFDIHISPEYSFRIGNYMRTITYTLADGNSFAVLVGRYSFNTSVKMIEPEIIMDFNPNKVCLVAWKRIFDVLRIGAKNVTVQRFDLAIDFPIVRSQLQLVQRPGSVYHKLVSPSGAITEYTGDRSHHAAVKLYDKGADLGIDLICSRLEITIDPAKYKGIRALLPTITTIDPVELSLDFMEFPFEVKAVILHPDLYDVLKASVSRNTFPKYKKMIAGYGQTFLTLTDAQCSRIDAYVHSYLVNLTAKGS